MGDIPPGWYEDEHDVGLARWWDGARWTEHTIVIADQVPGVEPPPPAADGPAPDPEPPQRWDDDAEAEATSVWALADDVPTFAGQWEVRDKPRTVGPPGPPTLADRVRDLPPWFRVVAPLLVLLILILAVATSGAFDGDEGARTDTTTLDPARLQRAAEDAQATAGLPSLTTTVFSSLIPIACEAARVDDPGQLADRIARSGYDDDTLEALVDGLQAGTLTYCPTYVNSNPGFFDAVVDAVDASPSTVLPPTVPASSTSSTSSTSTTVAATTTTRRPSPSTTAATTTVPATTTTAAPATTTSTTVPDTTTSTTAAI